VVLVSLQPERTVVYRYNDGLRPRLYAYHNPMTNEEAKTMEVEKARRLRNRGYAVWQK
jgi:hypothetical protein